jgi:hypothetical protein
MITSRPDSLPGEASFARSRNSQGNQFDASYVIAIRAKQKAATLLKRDG